MRMKKLHSNELIVSFEYSNMDRDYDFFYVTTSDKYIKGGANFLDLDEIKISALQFESGKCFWIMLPKGSISRAALIDLLNQKEDGNSLSIKAVESKRISDHLLIQLFMNALTSPKDNVLSFNNLTGKLLCFRPTWLSKDKENFIWSLQCLELKVNADMCIKMIAHKMTSLALKNQMSFEKRKLQDYPQYEFSYNNNTLRRVDNENKNRRENFIMKPIDRERGGITFFDFSDYEKFSYTKIGVLYDVMKALETEFDQYLQVKVKGYIIDEILELKRTPLEEYRKIVSQEIIESGIHLVDEVQSDTSKDYLQDIADNIKEVIPAVKCSIGKKLSKQKFNVCYIHDSSFYSSSEMDPYQKAGKDYVVQHITLENFNYRSVAAVNNILKELIIKKDIATRKITLVDWSKYGYQRDWIFGIADEEVCYFMIIHPDGSFKIEPLERNLFTMSEYDKYMEYFGLSDNEQNDCGEILGLIRDADGNINLIKDTNLYSIPNYKEIGNLLKDVANEGKFFGQEVRDWLNEIVKQTEKIKVKNELSMVIPKIDLDAKYSKREIMDLFKSLSTKKEVVRLVFENKGIMLYAYLRGEKERNEYLSGNIDINYMKLSEKIGRFSVGEVGSGMKPAIERASVIREIQAVDGSKLFFEKLLSLMGVEFVRFGRLTVLPFPFKYLREYILREKNDIM